MEAHLKPLLRFALCHVHTHSIGQSKSVGQSKSQHEEGREIDFFCGEEREELGGDSGGGGRNGCFSLPGSYPIPAASQDQVHIWMPV